MIISLFFVISALMLAFIDPHLVAWQPGSGLMGLVTAVTHMFGHANFNHLMGNYLTGFPYALYVEHKLGKIKFIRAWFCCGFAALASQIVFQMFNGDPGGMIGSSGAIFGIIACALALPIKDRMFNIAAKIVLCYYIVIQMMYAYMVFTNPMFAMMVRVAFAAHLGGICMGIFLALREKRESNNGRSHTKRHDLHKKPRGAKVKSLPRRKR